MARKEARATPAMHSPRWPDEPSTVVPLILGFHFKRGLTVSLLL